jgi:hypothetical protein
LGDEALRTEWSIDKNIRRAPVENLPNICANLVIFIAWHLSAIALALGQGRYFLNQAA